MKISLSKRGEDTVVKFIGEKEEDYIANLKVIKQYGHSDLLVNFDDQKGTFVQMICSRNVTVT